MITVDEYLLLLFITFLGLGFVMPIINQGFNQSYTGTNAETIRKNVGDSDIKQVSDLSATAFIKSIIGMFFFTFGDVPLWIDTMILLPLRLLFYTLIYTKIRSG